MLPTGATDTFCPAHNDPDSEEDDRDSQEWQLRHEQGRFGGSTRFSGVRVSVFQGFPGQGLTGAAIWMLKIREWELLTSIGMDRADGMALRSPTPTIMEVGVQSLGIKKT